MFETEGGYDAIAPAFARQLERENRELLEALEYLMEMTEPPERDCHCHIVAPCGWCEECGGVHDAHQQARAAIAKAEGREE